MKFTKRRAAFAAFGMALVALAGVSLLYRPPAPDQLPATGSFGGVSLILEYATSSSARERGLSRRESIPANYGMLFAFKNDGYYGFWMKEMKFPIDMFWLDSKGQVVSQTLDISPDTFPTVFYPSRSARYVLETAAGFARRHAIATGTRLTLPNFPVVLE